MRGRAASPEVIALARRMWLAHERVETIAECVGFSPLSVKHWRTRYKWPTRRKLAKRPVRAIQREKGLAFTRRRCTFCGQLTPGSGPCRWCQMPWAASS